MIVLRQTWAEVDLDAGWWVIKTASAAALLMR